MHNDYNGEAKKLNIVRMKSPQRHVGLMMSGRTLVAFGEGVDASRAWKW
jgi:hypothetical protein